MICVYQSATVHLNAWSIEVNKKNSTVFVCCNEWCYVEDHFQVLLSHVAGVSNLIQQLCRLSKGLRLLNLSKTSLTSKGLCPSSCFLALLSSTSWNCAKKSVGSGCRVVFHAAHLLTGDRRKSSSRNSLAYTWCKTSRVAENSPHENTVSCFCRAHTPHWLMMPHAASYCPLILLFTQWRV